jgi:hypothetical protein
LYFKGTVLFAILILGNEVKRLLSPAFAGEITPSLTALPIVPPVFITAIFMVYLHRLIGFFVYDNIILFLGLMIVLSMIK